MGESFQEGQEFMTSMFELDLAAEAVAAKLRRAEQSRVACSPVKEELAAGGVSSAYRVQQINVALRLLSGRRLIGHKIGLTSPAVQKQLGVSEPDYGCLLSDMVLGDGGTLPLGRLLQPKAEAEIALVLGQDLDMPDPNIADVMRATALVFPAIEIVDSRISDWKISLLDTIADNASSGMFVLGTPGIKPEGFAFSSCSMKMTVDGNLVSEGSGASCMGSPLNAAAWLATCLHALNKPLRAGQILLTGALGPMVPISAGQHVRASIEGLGDVSFNVEGAPG